MFFTGLTILSILSSVNPLSATPLGAAPLKCISKVKTEIVNVSSDESVFFSF